MKAFFIELFGYNHHCNQKLAEVFYDNMDKTPEKAIKLYNHLLNPHQVWNNRIELNQQPFGVWDMHPVQDYTKIDRLNLDQTIGLLDKFDLNESTSYTNTKGLAFHNSIRDVFFHVINHSTYHRGQIATEFRSNGMEPLVTDYIFYKR